MIAKAAPSAPLAVGLSFVAGFADASTFVHLSGLFAAHITGNIVLLATSLTEGMDAADTLKFASFPGFLLAVWLTALLPRKLGLQSAWPLLWIEAAILTLVGAVSLLTGSQAGITLVTAALGITIVFAMGLQNQAQTHLSTPPTTVMTGNVTRLVAGLAMNKAETADRKILFLEIAGFTIGCVVGALSVVWLGLSNFLPLGVALGYLVWREAITVN